MLSIEILLLSLILLTNTIVLWILAYNGWKVTAGRYFTTAVFFINFWTLGALLYYSANTHSLAEFGIQMFYVAPMLAMFFLLCFANTFPRKGTKPYAILTAIVGAITVLFAGFILLNPGFLTQEIAITAGEVNRLVVNKDAYFVYMLYFNLIFTCAFIALIAQIMRHKGQVRKQVVSIFIGTFMAALLSLVTNLLLPYLGNSEWIWLGPVSTLFYIYTVSFSIVKHQLFDIKLAAVRGVAYIGVLLTLSLIYYAAAYVASFLIIGNHMTTAISVSPFNIFLALILAFLFQPIKYFFDRVTNGIFYRDNYKSEEFFASLSTLLSSTVELRGLLERASEQIATTLKAEQAFFFLYYQNDILHHMSAGTHDHSRLPVYDARILDEYAEASSEKIFLTDYLQDSAVRRMLVSHKVALVMPLRNGERIMGYVLLGDHRSGTYTKRDLSVLTTISNELVIAIQNALSLHEVKELNATLQQRIDVATKELRASNAQLKHLDETKDEFMSMASHQLRTPLTSIKGYLSMVLDGDAGQISPQQHKLLSEAFGSSERMVRLIADFLNVSRLQTGKFVIDKTHIELGHIVRQEVENLRLMAAGRKLSLDLKLPDHELPLYGDEAKLRTIIMNFIDNAIFYSKPDSTITVAITEHRRFLEFTVRDTGIGVPKEEQARLFHKFYRASNARKQRPDGTGVGLFLAHKVIAGHYGTMVFHSVEGRGSTFGFRLPIAKESTK